MTASIRAQHKHELTFTNAVNRNAKEVTINEAQACAMRTGLSTNNLSFPKLFWQIRLICLDTGT